MEPLPISDRDLIAAQHRQRTTNHPYSEKSKSSGNAPAVMDLSVGDIVYLNIDKSKLQPRARYLIVSIDGPWCFVRKFAGAQIRSSSYKVKLSECYRVPSFDHDLLRTASVESDEENEAPDEENEVLAPIHVPPPEPPDTPDIISNPLGANCEISQSDRIPIDNVPLNSTVEDKCTLPEDTCSDTTSCTPTPQQNSRPKWITRLPDYLHAYDLSG